MTREAGSPPTPICQSRQGTGNYLIWTLQWDKCQDQGELGGLWWGLSGVWNDRLGFQPQSHHSSAVPPSGCFLNGLIAVIGLYHVNNKHFLPVSGYLKALKENGSGRVCGMNVDCASGHLEIQPQTWSRAQQRVLSWGLGNREPTVPPAHCGALGKLHPACSEPLSFLLFHMKRA